jgi:hypothetical protein
MKNPTFIPSNLPALSFGELKNYLWFGGTGFLLLAMGLLGHLTAVRWAIVFLMASWLMVGVRGHLRARKAMTTQVKLFFSSWPPSLPASFFGPDSLVWLGR